jgi:hypothetical protein
MTNEIDGSGHYVGRKHVVVSFLLEGISDLELTGFGPQNVISSAEISRANGCFELNSSPCYGEFELSQAPWRSFPFWLYTIRGNVARPRQSFVEQDPAGLQTRSISPLVRRWNRCLEPSREAAPSE